jgi:hypothetical protein
MIYRENVFFTGYLVHLPIIGFLDDKTYADTEWNNWKKELVIKKILADALTQNGTGLRQQSYAYKTIERERELNEYLSKRPRFHL